MSVATPTASSPEPTSPVAPTATEAAPNVKTMDQLVMQYLQSRGHESTANALGDAIGATGNTSTTLSVEDLLKKMAVFAEKSTQSNENTYKEAVKIVQDLVASGTTHNIKNVIMNVGPEGAEDVLALNPEDKHEGFRELEAWVEGSLDIYRVRAISLTVCFALTHPLYQPEFRPILYPVFCHFYMDLVQLGFKDAGTFHQMQYQPLSNASRSAEVL
jgi:transcription initiation factor TFIID subunit 5